MGNSLTVLKISGHYLDDEALLRDFAEAVSKGRERIVIVHGGGVEITRLQERLNIEARYVDGLRVTDSESLALVEMVLCGSVNKRLVRHLLAAGVDALGMSGVDRGLARARPMRHKDVDMQFTGQVESIRAEVLFQLLDIGVTPVVAPVSLGPKSSLNLNADTVSAALAGAMRADTVVYISNVSGVLVNGQVAPKLYEKEAEALIAEEVIVGGMIPKVRSALDVLSSGVSKAVITDLPGWAAGAGTSILRNQ